MFNDADVKGYYDLSYSEKTVVQRHIISILIIKGQFIDSLLRRKFSTQSLETRSHHLSILVAENSLINVFNLKILM